MKPKVVVIGLDGATLSLFEPLAKKGWLPNLAELMNKGCRGQLRSTIPPYTPTAWSSIYTGMNPGKHGVFGFFRENPQTRKRELCNSSTIAAPKIWEILNKNGIRTGLVNLPLTYPPQPIDGYMVTGLMTPPEAKNFTWPSALTDELLTLSEPYVINETVKPKYTLLKRLSSSNKGRRAACLHLLKNHDCDFLMIVFIAPDRIQHAYWKYLDENNSLYHTPQGEKLRPQIEACYRELDETIGEIISELGDESLVFCVSDHGFQSFNGLFLINNWLANEGCLSFKPNKWFLTISQKILYEICENQLAKNIFVKLSHHLKKGLSLDSGPRVSLGHIDWTKTLAFGSELSLFINRSGRGANNPSSEEEYLRFRSELVEKLKHVTDSSSPFFFNTEDRCAGMKMESRGHCREDIYEGPYFDMAPDIIPEIGGFSYPIHEMTSLAGSFISNPPTGTHDMNGLLIAYGKNVLRNREVQGSTLYDIAPTILHSFGIPVPEDMDGKVLLDIFEQGQSQIPVEISREANKDTTKAHDSVYSQAEAAEMEQQLRDMGYI